LFEEDYEPPTQVIWNGGVIAVATIPAGCAVPVVNGTTYYLCGNTWFTASYGANGIFYRVVPTP
jgi:hypothetical protein